MKRNDITLAPMTEAHVLQVALIERQCFSLPWTEACIAKELTNPLSLWLIAADGETVAGYVGSQTVLGEADIMNVAVAPGYRRQGIAEALLRGLEDALRKDGVYSLTLEVRPSNEAAIELYHKLGYREVGRRPGYYHRPREDALILRKEWEV
ncbi:MAG: ribosomal protein S18-alanine N-acetyltransferase [Oscillospiraceae bacterium]|nr:ribosomal protein S18-alanine N-acetyltransferase [Oscillospiraceae bacterium]